MAGADFIPGAHLELFECNGNFVEETINEWFRTPTVPVGEVPVVKN